MPESASRAFIPFSTHRKRDVVLRFWAIVGQFWRGPDAMRSWLLTIGIATALVMVMFVNVGVNRWQSLLFNALERKDGLGATYALVLVPLLVLGGAGAGALVVYTRETLQVFWRAFVIRRLIGRWVERDRFRAIQEQGREPPNPEYRIADDVRLALDPVVDFAIGFFSAALALIAFIGILWTVGGSLKVTVSGTSLTIPAFMVLAALGYGLIVSVGTAFIGRPLVDAIARKNETEARLRFDLTHLREHAHAVRDRGDGQKAHRGILDRVADLVLRSRRVVGVHTRITWLSNGNGVVLPVFGIILATPKYLAGGLTLGDVVSLGAAFQQTQMALCRLADTYRVLAAWYAAAGRVVDLIDALDDVDEGEAHAVGDSARVPLSPAS